MSTYVFAIGGSGARVLRSLTMLLAAGCKNTATANELVPIIIDYDVSNGDTTRTQTLMKLYRDLNRGAYNATPAVTEQFFCSPLSMLRDKCDTAHASMLDPNTKYSLHLGTAITSNNFSNYIGFNGLGTATGNYQTRQLLESLYDTSDEKIQGTTDDNPKAELHMNLHKGFRGCPNLGCIVTKQLENSPELQLVINTLIQATDKIVIVGSVFGGTGASGIPMLLDILNSNPKTQNAKKAVVAVLPYFSLTPPNAKSAIDSNIFVAKTKAAIGAYELPGGVNSKTNCIYYVGDEAKQAYDNKDGEAAQKNEAHYVEMIAATCVMDFISQTGNGAFVCGLDNWQDDELNRSAFFDETYNPYIHPLARFKMFSTFCKRNLFKTDIPQKEVWYHGISETGALAIGDKTCKDYRKKIREFIDEFDAWIKEMANMQAHRPLILFNETSDYKDVWQWKKLERRTFFGGMKSVFDDDDFCKLLTDRYNELSPRAANGVTNHPEYVFWVCAKYTMDKVDNKIASL